MVFVSGDLHCSFAAQRTVQHDPSDWHGRDDEPDPVRRGRGAFLQPLAQGQYLLRAYHFGSEDPGTGS